MVETPRLQAKQIFHCREATFYFHHKKESSSTVIPANPPKENKSRNPGKMGLCILDAGSVIPDLIRDRHDTIVDFNQPY